MKKTSFVGDLVELSKLRICLLSLAVATLGFVLGSDPGYLPWGLYLTTMTGLLLVGAGCGALNHYLERDLDARMRRTQNRPLPAGRLSPRFALLMGIVTSVAGTALLALAVNVITALLGILTLFSYLAVYTPMKRQSSLSTLVGAVPGALPPLMGWTAARGAISVEGIILFGILFLWQIPHFLALAWMYREDYARAGFPILSVVDEEGIRTAQQVVLYSMALLPLTLMPSLWGLTGKVYFFGSLALGLAFLTCAVFLAWYRSMVCARRLFFASILYLPLLGVLMCWDRT
jgi:heme o synthase